MSNIAGVIAAMNSARIASDGNSGIVGDTEGEAVGAMVGVAVGVDVTGGAVGTGVIAGGAVGSGVAVVGTGVGVAVGIGVGVGVAVGIGVGVGVVVGAGVGVTLTPVALKVAIHPDQPAFEVIVVPEFALPVAEAIFCRYATPPYVVSLPSDKAKPFVGVVCG